MASHIFMVQEILEREYKVGDVARLSEETGTGSMDEGTIERKMITAMRKMIEAKGEVSEEIRDADIRYRPESAEENPKALKVGKAGSLTVRFGKYLRGLKKKSKLKNLTLCHKCGEPPADPLVTNSLHVYCTECLSHMAYEASENDMDGTPCLKCSTAYNECESCEGLKELDVPDLSASIFQDGKEQAPKKGKFKLNMNWVDSNDDILLSTKPVAVVAQLERWIAEDPESKIIVFTEWHMVMHVLGRMCQQKRWNCCHYNGKMSMKGRARALNAFQDDPSLKIMIASLKCGGTGLNLTVASKVICVDLWFNSCVEEQGKMPANDGK